MSPRQMWRPNGPLSEAIPDIEIGGETAIDTAINPNSTNTENEHSLRDLEASYLQVPQARSRSSSRSSNSFQHPVFRITYPTSEQPDSVGHHFLSFRPESIVTQGNTIVGESCCGTPTGSIHHTMTPTSSSEVDVWEHLEGRQMNAFNLSSYPASESSGEAPLPSSAESSIGYAPMSTNCLCCLTKDELRSHFESLVEERDKTIEEYEKRIQDLECTIQCYEQRYGDSRETVPKRRRLRLDQRNDSITTAAERRTPVVTNARIEAGAGGHIQEEGVNQSKNQRACVLCRMKKWRCPRPTKETDICKNCEVSSQTIDRLPCIRTRIGELSIFRCGTGENDTWTERREVNELTDLTTYTPQTEKELTLTHGFGTDLKVRVKQYRPLGVDKRNYTWRDELDQVYEHEMPPYALFDIVNLIANVNRYIVKNQDAYIQHFINEQNVTTAAAFSIASRLVSDGKVSHRVCIMSGSLC